jgi:hypothetical protein
MELHLLLESANFNSEGYAHYEGIECSTYNPFSKIEKFLEDFYELYDADSDNELSEVKIESILKTLMNARNAKYSIKNNLVTLYNAKAKDIFVPVTFMAISLFFFDCKITSENFSRLCNNPQLLDLFSKLLFKEKSCLEWINILPISTLGIDYEITIKQMPA